MGKRVWIVLWIIVGVMLLSICVKIRKEDAVNSEITDQLSFFIINDEHSDVRETVSCWKQDDDVCYVFLPSYAQLNKTEVHLESEGMFYLDGIQLSEGFSCNGLELEKAYVLSSSSGESTTLTFVRSENVPSIFIDTAHGDLSIVHADKKYKENSSIRIYSSEGEGEYKTRAYSDRLRGHGNSTWDNDKKSYNLYLDRSYPLLGMNDSMEWALIANAEDETNLKNKIVLDFIDKVSGDERISPKGELTELFINGDYLGMYLLSEKVQDVAATTLEEKGYSLVVHNNTPQKMDRLEVAVEFKKGYLFEIVDPRDAKESTYDQLEECLKEVDQKLYTDEWKDYFDMESFARKYLIEEVFSNKDGACSSQYYYWDQDNSRIFAGPCWDYDLTMGDTTWSKWISPNNLYVKDGEWFEQVFDQQEFCEYYEELYESIFLPLLKDLINGGIMSEYVKIQKASANNYIRWAASPNTRESYDPQDMISFLAKHIDFLNSIWLENEEYCRVSMECNGIYDIAALYLPKGSSARKIPTPEEIGFEEGNVWLYKDSGELFKYDSEILEDVDLYMDNYVKPGRTFPSYRILYVYLTILLFVALFMVVIILNYRNGFMLRRTGDE